MAIAGPPAPTSVAAPTKMGHRWYFGSRGLLRAAGTVGTGGLGASAKEGRHGFGHLVGLCVLVGVQRAPDAGGLLDTAFWAENGVGDAEYTVR